MNDTNTVTFKKALNIAICAATLSFGIQYGVDFFIKAPQYYWFDMWFSGALTSYIAMRIFL